MTDENITEAFDLIRHHSSPLAHALIESIERAWQLDREALLLRDTQINLLRSVGHISKTDPKPHSRLSLLAGRKDW